MRRGRGKRFDDGPKLNIKKVIAVLIAILVVVMVIASVVTLIKRGNKDESQTGDVSYFALYTNDKWGVIDSNGDVVIPASYEDMIIVPNKDKGLFIVNYDINYETEEYKVKILNENKDQILTGYSNIEALDNFNSSDDVWYEENVLKFKKDGKYGLIDFDGNQILPAEYDDITTLKGIERSILITKDGKVGLVNNVSKDIIIEPKYSSIKALGKTYNDGYIVKDENGKCGIIGPDKRVILENNYDDVLNISGNDMYVVKTGDEISVIQKDGTVVMNSGFSEVKSIDGNNIIVKVDNSYGVKNTLDETIIEPKYEDLTFCFNDTYIAKENGKYGVINIVDGNKIDFKYERISYRKDAAFFECENANYTCDIYNREFEYKVTGIVSKVDTKLSYIKIRVNDETKYYTFKFEEKTNKDVLTDNTLFLVKKDGKYGYINKDGEQVVDCIYDDAMEQNEYGFCAVKKDGKWGCLKSDGAVLLTPSVELNDNLVIDFIGKWHLDSNLELEAYTD